MKITLKQTGPRKWLIGVAGVLPNGEFYRRRFTQDHISKAGAQKAGENAWVAKRDKLLGGSKETVEEYAERWLSARVKRGLSSAVTNKYELARILPAIGHVQLTQITRDQILAAIKKLEREGVPKRGKGKISPRSVRHSYTTLRTMLADAVTDGIITSNPATLRAHRDEVPTVKDKDPLWRRTATYTPDEVKQLIGDERIGWAQRVAYALETLAGLRYGEASALRWQSWDRKKKPLGELAIFEAYDSNNDRLKETKTGVDRHVPVHATLATMLEEWHAKGWRKTYGRDPKPSDLVIPVKDGRLRHRTKNDGRYPHAQALELLEMRHRRQHDLRRTFVTLCIAGGASKDLLKWITHGPPRGIVIDDYTSPPWPVLCKQVECLTLGD